MRSSSSTHNVACTRTTLILITIITTILAEQTLARITISTTTTSTKQGFSAQLIKRDSPLISQSSSSSSSFDRLHRSIRRSISRARATEASVFSTEARPERSSSSSSSSSSEIAPIESRVIASHGEYLMNVSIGTPPVTLLGIADTGSDLVWTQCRPCQRCFKQTPRMFDPEKSTSYRQLECGTEECSSLSSSTCQGGSSESCGYSYSYGDRSFTRGDLATETLIIGSVELTKTTFGCGHNNGGTFDESGSGLIGLGGGPLSLISQLGKTGNGKFSYCLVPLSSEESLISSKIVFGDSSIVSGRGTVSTPLVSKDPNTFYFLTLEAITVGDKKLQYHKNNNNNKLAIGEEETGNIIIDSGTTLTFLPAAFHDELVSAMSEAVEGAERVSDPRGVMSLCYKDSEGTGGLGLSLPTVTVHFAGGADLVLQPLNTFARVEEDVVCLTVVPSDQLAIFGNLAQMNFLVGYDTEAGKVSFKPADCTRDTI